MKVLSLRLPDDIYEHLRTKAFNDRCSITSLIIDSLQSGITPSESDIRTEEAIEGGTPKKSGVFQDKTVSAMTQEAKRRLPMRRKDSLAL